MKEEAHDFNRGLLAHYHHSMFEIAERVAIHERNRVDEHVLESIAMWASIPLG